MNTIKIAGLTGIILAFFASCSSQQNIDKATTATQELLNNQRYTFVAQSVFPTEDARFNPRIMFPNGNNLYQLTSRYDLKVTPDSVIAYLPFFGRSFVAPVNPSEGGIKFTSTKFSYKENTRKGSYNIDIIPADVRDIRMVYLTVSRDGYATLQIQSLNKTPISYYGRIENSE